MNIVGESSLFNALQGIQKGSVLRITFRVDAGHDVQRKILRLSHKLDFDAVWVAVMHNRIAAFKDWGECDAPSRTTDFTVKEISGADRDVFAYELHSYVEAVEIIQP